MASQFSVQRRGGNALTAASVTDLPSGLSALPNDDDESDEYPDDQNEAYFVFGFSVKNETADAFDTTVIYDGQSVRQTTIQGFCSARVRVAVAKADLGDVRNHSTRMVDPTILRTALERLLKLRWRQNRLSGEVAVQVPAGLITERTTAIVLLPQFRLRHALTLGGSRSDNLRLARCNCHEVLQLHITVANLHENPTMPSTLSILTVQTAETGSLNPTLPLALHPIGTMAATVPALQPGDVYTHTVGFVCLARGRFVISYMCDTRGGLDSDEPRRDDESENSSLYWGLSIALEVEVG
jgi:hypothetical protein